MSMRAYYTHSLQGDVSITETPRSSVRWEQQSGGQFHDRKYYEEIPGNDGPTDALSPFIKLCVEVAERGRKELHARGDVREGGTAGSRMADIAVGVMCDVKCRVAPEESGREGAGVEKRQARQTVTRRPCSSPPRPLPRRLSLPHQRFCLVHPGHQLCSVLASRAVQPDRVEHRDPPLPPIIQAARTRPGRFHALLCSEDRPLLHLISPWPSHRVQTPEWACRLIRDHTLSLGGRTPA